MNINTQKQQKEAVVTLLPKPQQRSANVSKPVPKSASIEATFVASHAIAHPVCNGNFNIYWRNPRDIRF